MLLVFKSVTFVCANSSVNNELLTVQPIVPELALQLKVAVDPSVALTDLGPTIAETEMISSHHRGMHVEHCGESISKQH